MSMIFFNTSHYEGGIDNMVEILQWGTSWTPHLKGQNILTEGEIKEAACSIQWAPINLSILGLIWDDVQDNGSQTEGVTLVGASLHMKRSIGLIWPAWKSKHSEKTATNQRGPPNAPHGGLTLFNSSCTKHHVRWQAALTQTPDMGCLCTVLDEYNKPHITLITSMCQKDSASMRVWICHLWGGQGGLCIIWFHQFPKYFLLLQIGEIIRDKQKPASSVGCLLRDVY